MRLHLVDGTYELYRAHYAPRPGHASPEGQDLKATVGVVASLLALLHDAGEDVTHLAVAFDNPIRSFRNDLYAHYKNDEGVPAELRAQFDTVEAAVRALGVAVWSMNEHEADDGMASGAFKFRDAVDQVRIMTPDKDLGQCIRGTRVVQVDRRQMKVTDEEAFVARRGFPPTSMPDYLALTGDAADGFPGLPGFGEKGAGMLIGAYKHLEAIPASAAAWFVKPRGAMQLAATLSEHRQEALLYRKLATLVEDAPVAASLDEVRFAGVPRERFEGWCEEVGSKTLRAMPRRWDT
ncbi:MAG TPA: 5'-3' exonuclease H3TH domain-containing protein [Polyangia bacterium]|nr:5'-3' exonuclease H3TH domain-containing protein [Polyangia bacterium]